MEPEVTFELHCSTGKDFKKRVVSPALQITSVNKSLRYLCGSLTSFAPPAVKASQISRLGGYMQTAADSRVR
jgi:hypothetical protein